jgi:8-oxo-dGTP pyrophosphatase MutT (NUDIX family)
MSDMRCDEDLFNHMKANLDRFARLPREQDDLKRAAVAITIVDIEHDPDLYDIPYKNTWNRNAAIILTRRASRLKNHAGQWALPGGRMDTGETPQETALRELEEEVGLRLDMDRVIGCLDDYSTRSGFIISPVVVWGGTGLRLTPNLAEVDSIHRIPLAEFLRTDAPILQEIPGSKNPVLLMPIGRGSIASPTAAMLYQFREVAIFGRSTRVAHYEQPSFAWQ